MSEIKPVRRYVAFLLAAIAVVVGGGQSSSAQTTDGVPEPFVKIVSVKLTHPFIYRSRKPNSTILDITLIVRGQVPQNATATVEIGSYSGKPPGNDLLYSPTSRVVSLRSGAIHVEFKVSASPKTKNGSVIMATSIQWGFNSRHQPVAIGGHGIYVINVQPDYHQWRTELEIKSP